MPPIYPVVVRESPLDWVKFDAHLARDGSVDPVDKALYAALASFADQEERTAAHSTDPDDEDIPTRKKLATCIGRSVDTVDRATKRLEERGLIEVVRMKDPRNPTRNIPSSYRLLDIELWDERAAARAERRRAEREAKRKEAAEKAAAEAAKAAEKAANADDSDRDGWPHPCGQGGRTHAARVAAPMRPGWPHPCGGTSSLQKTSSSSTKEGRKDEEEEESPSAKKPRGVQPTDLIQDLTDATADEASALWENIRPDVKKTPGGLIRHMAENGDLAYRLGEIRRQRASQARAGGSARGRCTEHVGNSLPCGPCRAGLNIGGEDADVVLALYASLGADAAELRPDLASHPKIAALTGAR